MRADGFRRAFTLIELLVVVAIIGLLISILLPSLQGARDQGKRAACLSNLRGLASAANAYASEDSKELIVPIHHMMISQSVTDGWPAGGDPEGYLWFRLGEAIAWGGRTPQVPVPYSGGNITVMMDQIPDNNWDDGQWVARTRPLNRYVAPTLDPADAKKFEWYHCPADVGYAENADVRDVPIPHAANVPLYDMAGNSYRLNPAGRIRVVAPLYGAFSAGALGHRLATLTEVSIFALFPEPHFYNFTVPRTPPLDPERTGLVGWHKRVGADNVAYVDGSARTTRVGKLAELDGTMQMIMGWNSGAFIGGNWRAFYRRGTGWKTDCYPTGGAWLGRKDSQGNYFVWTPAIRQSFGFTAGGGYPVDGVYDVR